MVSAMASAGQRRFRCGVPILLACASITSCYSDRSPYRSAAEDASRWIRATTQARGAEAVPPDLYYGTAGVVLFFLEAHHATSDARYLDEARAGADALLAVAESQTEPGLYTGIAGIGFSLLETGRLLGDQKYRAGAERCVEMLERRARPAGAGIEWNDTTDVIGGSAGTGLFLLYAARVLEDQASRELAVRAGRRLVELGRPEKGGLKWAMDPRFPRLMPGFSHGTAGVCYFLASLYEETRQREFLDAALAGARYLLAIADASDDGCLIFHDEPDGEELFYLGWCHGPAGTSRFFYKLAQVTGDDRWQEWVERGARSVLRSGIPEQRTPGFWNNMSQCCGDAGVADWFLALHRLTGKPEYLAFAKHVADYVLNHATRIGEGMSWIVAERRVAPDEEEAHLGYMLGAAGFGMLLLHLHEFGCGIEPAIRLPDSPW